MAKKYKITEEQLRGAIKDTLMEGPFGINNDFLKNIGMRNPGDNYQVNFQEIAQKCEEARVFIKQLSEYVDGKEDDVESGETQRGVKFNVSMKSTWWDNESFDKYDIQALDKSLHELSDMLWRIDSKLEEVKDCAEYFVR